MLLLLSICLSYPAVAAPLTLGHDFPYGVLQDPQGQLSLEQAAQRLERISPTERMNFSRGYVRDTFWLRFELPASAFEGQERWLELGPNFVDDIRLFYRPMAADQAWARIQTGDLLLGKSDLDYRHSVFILPPPPSGVSGHDVIIRVQSSSTTLLLANLWQPAELFSHATRTTSFWSFYFGLAAISSLLALVLALVLGGRLLWTATAFSVTYVLVASIQGYLNWLLPPIGLPVQHYLTSALTLTSYALVLLLCTETVNLRRHLPWAHKFLISNSVLLLSLVVLIPLDLYSTAIKIQTVSYLVSFAVFIFSVLYVWWRDRFRMSILLLGASPLVVSFGSLFGMFSILGWIPFRSEIYVIWQYALVVNMLLVMAIAVYRVREKKLEEMEKKQLAGELKAERDASFHQRQFMGMVSHEFRTPLAVISGSLENLRDIEQEANSIRIARYDKIRRATERLVNLTDNCLADARLDADELYLDPQPAVLFELARSAAALVQLSDDHQLLLTVEGKPADAGCETGCTVHVDAALIRIALSNVIENAVKYSAGGRINVDCGKRDGKPVVRISDEGPGISEQDTARIFERYRRGTDAKPGAGLGLYVARQIIRAHGGDLTLASSGPGGSCFEFTFNPGEGVPAR